MNFLAHIYLSGDNELIRIGNLMADGVRGKHYEDFPPEVQKGILLHRAIDTFTDAHPIFRESTKKLHERYHHYAGVMVDVFYDHFLAKNFALYDPTPLETFVAGFYQSLHTHYHLLNDKTKDMMPYMIRQNWLANYASIEGIERIMAQMDQRTGNQSGMRHCANELREHYGAFADEFERFFKEIRLFCRKKLTAL